MTSQLRQLYKVDTDCKRTNKRPGWRASFAYCKNPLTVMSLDMVTFGYVCTVRTGVCCQEVSGENGHFFGRTKASSNNHFVINYSHEHEELWWRNAIFDDKTRHVICTRGFRVPPMRGRVVGEQQCSPICWILSETPSSNTLSFFLPSCAARRSFSAIQSSTLCAAAAPPSLCPKNTLHICISIRQLDSSLQWLSEA